MSEEFFPLASAKYVVKRYDISSGEHLTIWDDPRLGINYVAACREILRLNEENEKLHKVIDKLQATMPVILTGKDGEYVCMNCGANMQYAKWQCPECE